VIRYLLRRIAYLVIVLFAATFMISAMLSLVPGDPAAAVAGENATPEQLAAVRKAMHLDQSLVGRYLTWVGHALRGDLGNSLLGARPISASIGQYLPVTLELVIVAQLLALGYAIVTSVYAADHPGGIVDRVTTTFSSIVMSTPQFVLGLVLILWFSVKLRWLPVAGWTPLTDNIWGNLKAITLPVLAIAAGPAGNYQAVLRSDMGRTLREDYIVMAEAKGLSPLRIRLRHALRPSLFSTVTLAGVTTARLIGGAVIVENMFALPGIGRMLVDSVNYHDYTAVQGVVAVIAVGCVLINTSIDLIYAMLDPRVGRLGSNRGRRRSYRGSRAHA